MKIEQLYTNCLAEAAYFIEDNGECAIIDPLRETQPYIERIEASGTKLKFIFETHFHADFVSGHVDLAAKTNATIVYGPGATTAYEVVNATDGQEFKVGRLTIKALHTPGHTLESTCWLLSDENGKPYCIFTGDTLFIGDVGRPDLAIKSDLTQNDLAGMMYDSLRNKIMPLADDIIVYPAHGAGSSCGKNMSKETFDTLGNQKQVNYALRPQLTKEQFIAELTDGILPAPQYFAKNAALNKNGYNNIDAVLANAHRSLTVEQFKSEMDKGALVLDVRHQSEFGKGFIPGSAFFGLDGTFAMWVGTLVEDLNAPLLLVCPQGREEEAVTRLARVGYDNVIGVLEGSFAAWQSTGEPTDTITTLMTDDFATQYRENQLNVLDVRKPGEFEAGHLPDAQNKPLDFFLSESGTIDTNKTYHIHCAGGYRSMIYASLLRRMGVKNLYDIDGGFGKIKTTGLPVTEGVHA
ncbi:MAG: rhodanese-like domain-containing protein [Bacteroidota bacterium]